MRQAQRRQNERILKVIKSLEFFEKTLKRTNAYVEKIRSAQERIMYNSSASKYGSNNYLSKDVWRRAKERINHAFDVFNKLHEESWKRDHVIVESLLDTQMGKMHKLLVKKDTHNALIRFNEIF